MLKFKSSRRGRLELGNGEGIIVIVDLHRIL